MSLPEIKPVSRRWVYAYMADVSAPSSAYAPVPFRGHVVKVGSVLYNAITVADSAMSTSINATAITGGTWTVTQAGSAAGDYDSAIPTALSTTYVKDGDVIKFTSDGGSSTTAPMMCFAEIELD